MKYNSKELWEKFKNSLIENLKNIPFKKFEEIWEKSDWTYFFKEELMNQIAKDSGLCYRGKEYLTVDAILDAPADNYGFSLPIIAIESENDWNDEMAWNEFAKLCFLNAPLKVIFSQRPSWNEQEVAEEISDIFGHLVKVFNDKSMLIGYSGFIIRVKESTRIVFYSLAFNDKGELIEDEKELVIISKK